MTLTLRAVSLDEQPLTRPITARFDTDGTIGRTDQNTMALPDPERHISRLQAEIGRSAGGWFIRNVGSSNPVIVGGRALAHGEAAPLLDNDEVRIGGYRLVVSADSAQARSGDDGDGTRVPDRLPDAGRGHLAPAPLSAAFTPPPTPASGANPFADLLGPGASAPPRAMPMALAPGPAPGNPFAQLPPAGIAPGSAGLAAAGGATPPPRLPDDFDPFAAPRPASAAGAHPRPVAGSAGPFDDMLGPGDAQSIDQWFNLPPPGRDRLIDEFMAGAGGPQEMAVPTDPLRLVERPTATAPAPTDAASPSALDHVHALHSAYRPPTVRAPSEPAADDAPRLPSVAPAAAPVDGSAGALWSAFCDGAGLSRDLCDATDAAAMQAALHGAGAMLRGAVDGTLQLMAARAATKQELHAGMTVIQSRHNNPLKFSPDVDAALEQLLRPAQRGFMPGPAAVADAMHDLLGHAIGSMAGTRAALDGVLGRFAPEVLECRLAAPSMLDKALPMTRRSRLWELYLLHFQTIRAEAADDFQALFGKAFVAAYSDQIERLRSHRGSA